MGIVYADNHDIPKEWESSLSIDDLPRSVTFQLHGDITCPAGEKYTITKKPNPFIITKDTTLTLRSGSISEMYIQDERPQNRFSILNGLYTGSVFGDVDFGFTSTVYQRGTYSNTEYFCPGEPDLFTSVIFYGKCDGSEFIGYGQNKMLFNFTGTNVSCNWYGWDE